MTAKALTAALALACAAIPVAAQETSQVAGASFGHYDPKPQYDGIATTSLYLPMRDGVRLAVKIERPAQNGKPVAGRFPVIWQHTLQIDRESNWAGRQPGLPAMPELAKHGYVVVQVARRGNGQSFGERRGYHDRNEAQDAFEIVQWLAAQPWSNGSVGLYGCSNTGDAAIQVLTVRPPALKAVFAGCFSWHKYDAFRRGGIFAQWGTGPTRTVEQDMAVGAVDGDEKKVLLRQAAEEHKRSPSLLELWKGMPYRDSYSPLVASRFWQEGSSANYADQIRLTGVPVYILGGWFDELRDQGLIAQVNLPGSRIVIGPWRHCHNDDFPLLQEVHRFFDHYLKGLDTGLAADDPIHYFTIDGATAEARKDGATQGTWNSARRGPLPGTTDTRLYLTAAGALQAAAPRGTGGSRDFAVKYDIACPDAGKGPFDSGPFAQPCHVEGMGVSFAGRALAADTEVTGHPVADLWIAADAADADLFAYLEDVAPDGRVRVVTEGRLMASLRATATAPWTMPAGIPWHRAFAEDARALNPGEAVNLRFDFMPTSWIFRAGHRLQVTISGADPRERDRPMGRLAKRITVLADRAHPSSVTLPVIAR
jgi:putative CocE/NonD family hydrolase